MARNNPIIKPYYLGCYPANVKPKGIKNNCCWVWNTDEDTHEGTHWICIVKNENSILFFDSFGKTPIFYKRKYWMDYFENLKCDFNLYTQLQRQSYISRTCGVWCLEFLNSYFSSDTSFDDVFDIMYEKLIDNEVKLQHRALKTFPDMINIYTRKCQKSKRQICKTYLETYIV
jgi:hypothetical protein